MLQRMIGAARLDPALFEEVEADTRATPQAMSVVALATLATVLGTLGLTGAGAVGLALAVVNGLFLWAIWAFMSYVLGTTLFRTPETEANWASLPGPPDSLSRPAYSGSSPSYR